VGFVVPYHEFGAFQLSSAPEAAKIRLKGCLPKRLLIQRQKPISGRKFSREKHLRDSPRFLEKNGREAFATFSINVTSLWDDEAQ